MDKDSKTLEEKRDELAALVKERTKVLAKGSKSEFWETLKEILEKSADPKRFLGIDENSPEGSYFKMRGEIQAYNTIFGIVESARKKVDRERQSQDPVKDNLDK